MELSVSLASCLTLGETARKAPPNSGQIIQAWIGLGQKFPNCAVLWKDTEILTDQL